MRKSIVIDDSEEKALIGDLKKRKDVKAKRIKRLLDLPDLTKKENSPVKILVDRLLKLPRFNDFDIVDFPRIVTVKDNFDLLNTPLDHPSRRETDTYYLSEKYVLRTHTTTMWPFYLERPETLEKLKKQGQVKALSVGIVFRKDEIDRNHFPAFHQIDGLYICRRDRKVIIQKDLEEVLIEVGKSIFGENLEWKFIIDSFPFTDPSVEMSIKFGLSSQISRSETREDEWMEILGAGLVHNQVLKNFGLDPEIYNGWAFGFGIDRLAMVKMGIPDIRVLWSENPRITGQFKNIDSRYKEVSKYPKISRDISFVIDKKISLNNYYEIVRDVAENSCPVVPRPFRKKSGATTGVIEEVKLLDSYENEEKFGKNKKSYTFRIVYRSPERTLTSREINKIQEKIRKRTKENLKAILR